MSIDIEALRLQEILWAESGTHDIANVAAVVPEGCKIIVIKEN